MINYNNYIYDESYVFGKQSLKERLEKQLGDFGEQLVMTLLGRLTGYSVAFVDQEGADLIASDKKGNGYAISVKSSQIGPTENETKVFKKKDQKKLCAFANEFGLIPAVAMIIIPKDFAFIDVYLLTLEGFQELADRNSNSIEENAVKAVANGFQINNYSLGTGKSPSHSDKHHYLNYLHTNGLINHVRLDVQNRESFGKDLRPKEKKYTTELLKDENLKRQLGDFGEYFLAMLLGQIKKYKVARVDHVGADLIATDRQAKKYAISVKTRTEGSYNFEENYYTCKRPTPKHELGKLQDFAEKYNMIPVVACVFVKPDFKGIDIYISSLKNWLDIGFSGKYAAVQYNSIPPLDQIAP